MSNPLIPRVGGILSADIAVPEHESEVRFYSNILNTGNDPLWRKDLMNNQGTPIIGLGAQSAAYADLPLQWMPHIQVADVAASAKQAVDLGGSELMHGKDANENSQWAVLLDPNGAAFGIIPVVSQEATPKAEGRFGYITWLELTVPNASATHDFYRQVIGWSVQDVEMDDSGKRYTDYNMIGMDGSPAAGISHTRGANTGLPPVWMLHLPVSDLSESLRRVEEGGGKIVKMTRGADKDDVYAVIQDPVGVFLALVPG